jgi:hypothetical protein
MTELAIGTVCFHRQRSCLIQINSEQMRLGLDENGTVLYGYEAVIYGRKNIGQQLLVDSRVIAPLDLTLGCWSAKIWEEIGWRCGERISK